MGSCISKAQQPESPTKTAKQGAARDVVDAVPAPERAPSEPEPPGESSLCDLRLLAAPGRRTLQCRIACYFLADCGVMYSSVENPVQCNFTSSRLPCDQREARYAESGACFLLARAAA
jgi:hypothetical protein